MRCVKESDQLDTHDWPKIGDVDSCRLGAPYTMIRVIMMAARLGWHQTLARMGLTPGGKAGLPSLAVHSKVAGWLAASTTWKTEDGMERYFIAHSYMGTGTVCR
jgi:hypothetical protein